MSENLPATDQPREPKTHVILAQGNVPILVSESLLKEIYEAAAAGKGVHISARTHEAIVLKPFPPVYTLARWESADKDKLARAGRFRCKYGNIHEVGDPCTCEPKHADPMQPLIHPAIRKKMLELSGGAPVVKDFPKLTYADQLRERQALGESRAMRVPELGVRKVKDSQNQDS